MINSNTTASSTDPRTASRTGVDPAVAVRAGRHDMAADSPSEQSVSFGPFRLFPRARVIERNGMSLALGSRALDILIVLVEHAGELVSHRELTSRVWRGLVVTASNLRVNVTGLRKALGDGEGQSRYIANIPGQGYCFVAPIARDGELELSAPAFGDVSRLAKHGNFFPPALSRMVGRDGDVRAIASRLLEQRFVTVVGPGGMGKTTVAVAIAHAMAAEFAGDVCFVDLGAVAEPLLVAATVASTLGLTPQTEDCLPGLMEFLRQARMLLILDNCDHVIGAAALLAEQVFSEATQVHILATSREALRVEGERSWQLLPLEGPPPDSTLQIAELMAFPAVQLFVERAAASASRFELSATDGATIAEICNRLDGVALAIEFAASRVGTYGVKGTAGLLTNRLGLHWQGRRTALPRHQTLHALLDWSYHLLTESERSLLRRLSVFVGTFTIEAAKAVAVEPERHQTAASDDLGHLVAKSLVSAATGDDGAVRYRLLETTRVFASDKLNESAEFDATAQRHAQYFATLMGAYRSSLAHPSLDGTGQSLVEHLGNVRAALGWCFGTDEPLAVEYELARVSEGTALAQCNAPDSSDVRLGVELAANSVHAFLDLSLLSECHKWSERALQALDDTTLGTMRELKLQEARAASSMWTMGKHDDVREALARGLKIARDLGVTSHYLRLLVAMHIELVRRGDARGSVAIAEELTLTAYHAVDVPYQVLSHWLSGTSCHLLGDQSTAYRHYAKGFASAGAFNLELFGLDCRIRALVTFARILWMRGNSDQAMASVEEALALARTLAKPLNLCFTLVYATPVLLWCGEWGTALKMIEELTEHPNWHSLRSFHATGLALKGELLLRTGQAGQGIVLLSPALQAMRADRDDLMLTHTSCLLGERLSKIGRFDEALCVVDEAIADAEGSGTSSAMPELLRVKADVLLSMPRPDEEGAETCLSRALACAQEQGALGWELRAAMTLAELRTRQLRHGEGLELLATVYGRFAEGFETHDLRAARLQLDELQEASSLHLTSSQR